MGPICLPIGLCRDEGFLEAVLRSCFQEIFLRLEGRNTPRRECGSRVTRGSTHKFCGLPGDLNSSRQKFDLLVPAIKIIAFPPSSSCTYLQIVGTGLSEMTVLILFLLVDVCIISAHGHGQLVA